MGHGNTDQQVLERIDAVHRVMCSAQRELLIAEVDRRELWRDAGARDMAQWLWMRYGLSDWKARRWIAAAHALEDLPLIAEAFASGELGVDKVVELTRFATPQTESRLIPWAARVSPGCIRNRGDLATRQSLAEAADAERARTLSWWYFDEGRRFGLEAELPAAQGAVVARALQRLAEQVPILPGEEDGYHAHIGTRRADALVALASSRLAQDPDMDRATVVVHASLDTLAAGGGAEVEGGGVIHPSTLDRLLCQARVQAVVEDPSGDPVHLGRMRREPPGWMLRQLRYRDSECRFPGCGARRFTQAHHVTWWERGGRTDLDNLVLICFFHHRLVHEYGWSIRRAADGEVRWFHPNGTRYRAGPAPHEAEVGQLAALTAAGS